MRCFKLKLLFPAVFSLVLCAAGHSLSAAEPVRLTDDGKLKFAPTFTADGREIVFSTHNVQSRVSLVRLRLSDGKRELLYPSMTDHQHDAAFSVNGRYHCFARSSLNPQLVLVIQDNQTQTESVFRPRGARSTVRTPRITPDNRRVVFTLSAPGGQQIASVNMQGRDLKKLTQSVGTNCWPSVSPDGKQIAFSSSRGGKFDIYVMNADGAGVRQITDSPVRDIRPAWSPDGKRIAFTSARDGNYEIYVMRADGSELKRVTNHPERDDFPTWHPDGQRLLSVSERDGRFDLYLMDVPPSHE